MNAKRTTHILKTAHMHKWHKKSQHYSQLLLQIIFVDTDLNQLFLRKPTPG